MTISSKTPVLILAACLAIACLFVPGPVSAQSKMYWTEYGGNVIGRANLDGSSPEDLISSDLGWPWGIALDVAGGKMYWVEFENDVIGRANLDPAPKT